MWITTSTRSTTPQEFYANRILRIVPLYYLITTAWVLLLVVAPSLLQTSRLDTWHVISSYLFIPSAHPVTGAMEPVVFAGWTLNYEMFFYLIFGACLILPASLRMMSTVGILTSLVLAGLFVDHGATVIGFYTSSILAEFAIGMALGWAFENRRLLKARLALAAGSLGFLALPVLHAAMPDAPRLLTFGLPATLIVAGGLSLDQARRVAQWRLPHLLGDASYSIYLTHSMTLSAFGQVWRKLGLVEIAGPAAFVAAAFVAAAVIGVACYATVEAPMFRASRRWQQAKKPLSSGIALSSPSLARGSAL
ncbi:MAG: acyltransferase [Alphaproteobacteria bacterium]|nr:acyltransferase [Alphaproteobacteria bacterium]